jgi:hypothetical protein
MIFSASAIALRSATNNSKVTANGTARERIARAASAQKHWGARLPARLRDEAESAAGQRELGILAMSALGQKRKFSPRAPVVRFTPESGYSLAQFDCLLSANSGSHVRLKILAKFWPPVYPVASGGNVPQRPVRAFTGSFTLSILANSTLRSSPSTLSTRRM